MGSTMTKSVTGEVLLSETEAAYFAGFVDGEGTISLARTRRREGRIGYRFRPYLSVCNTDLSVLRWLLKRCGNGRLVCKFTTRRHSPTRRDLYALDLGATQMRAVLPKLLPYLRVKRRQAELLLEFLSISVYGHQASDSEWQRVLDIHEELRRLNHRGTGPVLVFRDMVKPSRWKNQWGKSGIRSQAS